MRAAALVASQGPLDLRNRFQHTWSLEMIMALVIAGLVLAVLLFAIIRSFTPWGKRASQKHIYYKHEAVYLSLVTGATAFLIYWSFHNNAATPDGVSAKPYPPAQVTVNVLGYQWCWRFAYVGTPVSVTADCVNGRYPTLVVPQGETILFNVSSADVIHGFWLPYMRFKTWAYPNHVNSFENTFAKVGKWDGECAEFCGLYHYAMKFDVRVVTPAQFRIWLTAQEHNPASKPPGAGYVEPTR